MTSNWNWKENSDLHSKNKKKYIFVSHSGKADFYKKGSTESPPWPSVLLLELLSQIQISCFSITMTITINEQLINDKIFDSNSKELLFKPPDLRALAKNVAQDLLPSKSKSEAAYEKLVEWKKGNYIGKSPSRLLERNE